MTGRDQLIPDPTQSLAYLELRVVVSAEAKEAMLMSALMALLNHEAFASLPDTAKIRCSNHLAEMASDD